MPNLSYKDIIQEIDQKKIRPVYLIHGSERYFLEKVLSNFSSNIINDEARDFDLSILNGKDTNVGQILEYLYRYPMCGELVCIIIKNSQDLKEIEALTKYIEQPLPSSILILHFDGKSLDGRTKFYKSLATHAGIYESTSFYENQLPAVVTEIAKSFSKTINLQAAAILVENIGTDLGRIEQEIAKLALIIEQKKDICEDDIFQFIGINRDYSVYELSKALAMKDNIKAFRVLNYLKQNLNKQPPQIILGVLFNFFIKVIHLKALNVHSNSKIIEIIKTKSISAISEYQAAIKNYSIEDLNYIFFLFKKYDQMIKGVNNQVQQPKELLDEFVLQILHCHALSKSIVYE